ncbi:MAG TPA: DUF2971 domain-containing protein [Candidatus Binataceae bacterium]|nr:DUF2971 domain-containing protein [Candidatus Binataceae bacterium]
MSQNVEHWWSRETQWPPFLYRYRSLRSKWSREDVERVLAHNEISFSSPAWFNDPFDCKVEPSFNGSDEQKKRWLEVRYVPRRFTATNQRQKVEELLPRVDECAQVALTELLQKDIPDAGVLSLTGVSNDILMWSHYADGHHGVCLKFRGSCAFPANNWNFYDGIKAQKIIYSDDYPEVSFFAAEWEAWMKLMTACLLTKSKHWCYEHEWRAIEPPPESGAAHGWHKLHPNSLAGVILGCEISPEDELEVRAWLRMGGAQVPLFRAEKKPGRFELCIRED